MSDILLDSDGDVVVDVNDFVLSSGRGAIEQHLKQRLHTFLGEFFLDGRVGIPYFQQILVKNPSAVAINSIIKRAIINTPGILSLTSFSLELNSSRELIVEFRALSTEGEINFSEILP